MGAAALKEPSSLKADVWLHFGFYKYEFREQTDRTKVIRKIYQMEVK